MKKEKKSLVFSFVLTAVSVLFTLAVLLIDRQGITAGTTNDLPRLASSETTEDYRLGFASLNLAVNSAFGGFHSGFYDISKYSGLLVFLIPFLVLAAAFLPLLRAKKFSLKKIPRELLCVFGLYVAVGLVYVFFELAPVSFRPLTLPDQLSPEPSYPSSHTLLAVTLCVSAALALPYLLPNLNRTAHLAFSIVLYALAALVVVSRLLSGVHWFTDILGGLLISSTLLMFFYASLLGVQRWKDKR